MTTSGTSTFNPVRDQIIRRAGRQVNAWASGEIPSAQAVQDWSDALNAMTKEWQATGIHLWAEVEGILFLQPGQYKYTLGPNSTDHATQSYERTVLAFSAFGTSLQVASVANFIIGQQIGIILDTGGMFWSTINAVVSTPVPMITLTTGLPVSVSAGAPVVAYTSAIDRPLRILDGRRLDLFSLIEIEVQTYSRLDYHDLPNKNNIGSLNGTFYDPQLVNGFLWAWNNPPDARTAYTFTWMRQLQDFDTATNTADFPQEWINCITLNLADTMAMEYGLPLQRHEKLSQLAAASLERCMGFDKEPESIYAGCNFDQSAR